MKDEIETAVKFIIKLVKQNSNINYQDLLNFQHCLRLFLNEKFINHWHPDRPWQGQGYRCLRVNGTNGKEPTIAKAATKCGLKYSDLKLPLELTVWVDPDEVCCRFGEHKGSYCTLASFQNSKKQNYVDDMDLTDMTEATHLAENVKKSLGNGTNRKPTCPPLASYSYKENIAPHGTPPMTTQMIEGISSSSEAQMSHHNLSENDASSYNFPSFKRATNGPRVINTNLPFSYSDQYGRSYQQGDTEAKLGVSNRSPGPNGRPYYKPSSWVGYPSSISPPQPHIPSSYFEYSPPSPHSQYTSQENINYRRLSPVNQKLRWQSASSYIPPNSYAPANGWLMQRQLVGV